MRLRTNSIDWAGKKGRIVAAALALWIVAIVACLHPLARKYPGMWSAGVAYNCDISSCLVSSLVPGTPAAAQLRSGDRVLAVNGKSGFRGPLRSPTLITDAVPPGVPIAMQIQRNGHIQTVSFQRGRLPAELVNTALHVTRFFMFMAFVYLAGSGITFWMRPDLRTARWFALSTYLASARFAWIALSSLPVWDKSAVEGWVAFITLLYLPAAYRFLRLFPVTPPPGPFGMWLDRIVGVGAIAVFAFAGLHDLPRLVPAELSWQASAVGRFLLQNVTADGYVSPFFACACLSAGVVGFRATRQPDERRRATLLLASILSAIGAIGIHAALGAIGSPLGHGVMPEVVANAVTIIVPVTLVYAIVKHRVMGIRVILRLGLQYLMARGVLFAGLATPMIVAIWRVVSHPSMPAGELFGGTASGVLMAGSGLLLLARQPLLSAIDRRFFRSAWDAQQLLELLVGEIQRQNSFRALAGTVTSHINRAIHPASLDVYWRLERAGPFCAIGREPVAASSAFGKWLDATGPAGVLLVADLPSEARCTLRTGEGALLVTLPGSSGPAAGFILLGEKRSQEPWTKQELSLLRVAGSQLGLRHEVLLLEEEQLSAVDDERKRMSRELHDTLSQGFAGIFLHLESARHFMAENPEKSLSHVDEASGLARRSLASARASIRNLRTFGPGLDLQRELNDLAARLSAGPMVNIDCRAASEHQVPEEIAWHLLRIAEEGVTNAIKHSGATKIEVRLHTTAAWARLTVRDNGGGFDPDAPRSAGYGLIGMRERMHQFRGILEIVSSPGDGTEINASVALPEAATS